MPTQVDIIVGRRIRRRRRLMGMTQQALGQECGASFQSVQKYEAAQARISIATLWKVARALHVNVDFFFTGIDDGQIAPGQTVGFAPGAEVETERRLAA